MKGLTMEVSVSENQQTGKRRILTSIFKDEVLEVTFALDAEAAEKWAGKLLEMLQEVRGKQVIVPS